MSKHWNPGKKSVALKQPPRPSRIRREPVRLASEAELKKTEVSSREREMWGGIAGILLFATALAVLIVGLSIATVFRDDPDADAQARQFGQCYNAFGPNCVIDASTIRVAGQTVRIAGIQAPSIQGAQCEAERTRGIDSAERLANLLNSGPVTLGAVSHDPGGREVRSVKVGERDVGEAMVSAGIARDYASAGSWCGNGAAGG